MARTGSDMRILLFCLCLVAAPVHALNIFACEPEWASLAKELAGDKAVIHTATTALQNAHRIEARPSLIARVRSADLIVCTGADLEAGWLPVLLQQSGNAKVQPGTDGYFEAAQAVDRLEVPKVLDRSLGDVHPGGNPHVHTSPRNIARIAEALGERLTRVDGANAAMYRTRTAEFLRRWREALTRWEKMAAPLKGVPVVVYHRDWSYFIDWAGLREAGSLEPKPGLPPTPAHLAELIERMKSQPAKLVMYGAYNDPKPAQFLSERTGIPAVRLAYTVGGNDKVRDLFTLFDDTIARLTESIR
jgi:zinc/manganese transport system substrate-binding protein